MANERGRRKSRTGVVVSDKMDKTRVVQVRWSRPDPRYTRRVRRVSAFKAHDAANASHEGDTVRMVETRPSSKEKRWRIVEIVTKGERVEIKPQEVGASIIEEFSSSKEAPAAPEGAASLPATAAQPAPAEESPAPAEESKE